MGEGALILKEGDLPCLWTMPVDPCLGGLGAGWY